MILDNKNENKVKIEYSVVEALNLTAPQENIVIKGWIRTARKGKGVTFFELNDGSCLDGLQVVLEQDGDGRGDGQPTNYEKLSHLTAGSAICITGNLVESPAKGQKVELKASEILVEGTAPSDYPLQKKRHTFEYLRQIAHVRPRARTFGAVFRVRHALSMAIYKFFDERGFIQVHTPVITASDCEGAGEMFQVTTLPLAIPPLKDGQVDFSKDFFGTKTSLTVSGQLEAEIFAHAFKNVYTFGPTFRAENSNTKRHVAEFWMVEPEMAFCDLEGNIQLAGVFLKYIVKYVLKKCPEDMKFFDQWIEKGILEKLSKMVNSRIEVITYTEAVGKLKTAKSDFKYPVKWGMDLQTEHERYLTEEIICGPCVVTDYPAEIKAFYMHENDDGKTVAAMDLLLPFVGEIIGGSQRENREDILRRKIKEMDLDEKDYYWYLDLRKFGGVVHSGFGMGFERVLMYITGMKNIRDVIPFARTPGNADF